MAHSGNPTLCFPDGLVSITCQSRLVEVGSLPGVCFKIIYMDLLKSNSEVLASAGMFISTSCLSDFFFPQQQKHIYWNLSNHKIVFHIKSLLSAAWQAENLGTAVP